MKYLTIALILCLCLLSSIEARKKRPGHGANQGSCLLNPSFPEAMLSVSYAPGVCSNRRCVKHKHSFSIHGLWPNYDHNRYPSYCCLKERFNPETLEPILPELEVSKWVENVTKSRSDWKGLLTRVLVSGLRGSSHKTGWVFSRFNTRVSSGWEHCSLY